MPHNWQLNLQEAASPVMAELTELHSFLQLFQFSIIYLFLLFTAVLVDRTL